MSYYQQVQRRKYREMPLATVRQIRPGDWRDRLSDLKQAERATPINAICPLNAWAVRAGA